MMKKLVALLMALALLCTSIGAFAEVVPAEPKVENTPIIEPTETPTVTPTEAPTLAPTTGTPTETPTETPTLAPTKSPWDVELGEHHAMLTDEVGRQAATCEEDGWIEYKCREEKCALGTFKVTVRAHGHKVPEGAKVETDSYIKTPATCQSTGIRVWRKCAYGDHEWEQTINTLDHKWEVKKDADGEDMIVEATCLEGGYTVYECVNEGCDAEKHDDVTPARGHLWAPNPDAIRSLENNPYVNTDGEIDWEKIPAYDPTNADVLYLYTWSEADSVSCVDGGKLVKFTYCERCHFKHVIFTDSKYWTKLDHQAFLEDFIAQPETVKDEEYIAWLLDKVDAADRSNDVLEQGLNTEPDDMIICDGHPILPTTDPYGKTYRGFHHPVEIDITPAGCETDGLLVLKCTECPAEVKVVLPAHGHKFYYENVIGSAPTCMQDGKIMAYCEYCDYQEQVNIQAPGKHNFPEEPTSYSQVKFFETLDHVTDFSRIAECYDYTKHYACQGHRIQFTLSTGHTDYFTVTCTADRVTRVEVDKPVAGNGKHDKAQENYAYRPSTCTEKGYEYFYCNACGYSYGQELDLLPHVRVSEVVKAPTCTEDGLIRWTCDVCGTLLEEQVVPMTGHNYVMSDYLKESCFKDGYKEYTCTYCGDAYRDILPKHHTAPIWTEIDPDSNNNQAYKAPTCTETGLQSYECTVCHTPVLNEVIPALGHVYDMYEDKAADTIIVDGEIWNTYTPATCKNEAYYTRTCLRCGKKETKTVGEKLGHLMARKNPTTGQTEVSSLVLDTNHLPTCESTGKAYYNCVVCGKLIEDFVLPKLPCNEQVTWNPEKRVYEITCEKAEWSLWRYLVYDSGYLFDEINACTEDDVLATQVWEDIMAELKKKLETKDADYIPGIGGHFVREIPVIKTHYSIDLTDNVVTLTPDENCSVLKNPMIIVNWAYTLGDGTAFSYTRLFRQDDVLKYDLGLAETPVGSYLESITVIVTDTVTLDITEAAKGYGYEQFPG